MPPIGVITKGRRNIVKNFLQISSHFIYNSLKIFSKIDQNFLIIFIKLSQIFFSNFSDSFYMFHVFALAYLITGFLWAPYYFSIFPHNIKIFFTFPKNLHTILISFFFSEKSRSFFISYLPDTY